MIYRINVIHESHIEIVVSSSFDFVAYLRSECLGQDLACATGAPLATEPILSEVLLPWAYLLLLDGADGQSYGDYEIAARVLP